MRWSPRLKLQMRRPSDYPLNSTCLDLRGNEGEDVIESSTQSRNYRALSVTRGVERGVEQMNHRDTCFEVFCALALSM